MNVTQNPISPDPISGAPPTRDQVSGSSSLRHALTVEGAERARKGSDVADGYQSKSRSQSRAREKKKGGGLTEGDEHVLDAPENNLLLVMPAIGLVLFLSALDQTIVATALPTIAEDLNSSPSEYSWVGTAYLLASTLQTPINGRVSDIVGRKPMLYAAIVIFTVFSALCGAAKSSRWLIIARAFQGLGGGSIIGLTTIVVSDIVPLHKRGTYQGYMGASWGIASVLGPIFGGLLTEHASWRWCFYINLPTCGIALVFLIFTLHMNPTRKLTFKELRRTFDFLGLVLIMAASALIIVGFSNAADNGFDKPTSFGLIAAGAGTFVLAVVNFLLTKRNAIIPARIFKNRTTAFFMLGSTLHAAAFLSFNYLLPEMLQGLLSDSPLESGVHLLPFAVVVALMTIVAGLANSKFRIVRPVAWFGYAVAALGFGLFYRYFKSSVRLATLEGLLFLAGIGTGLSLQVPMLVIQAAMPLKDMAASTSAWSLTRSMGGSIGLAIFTAILNTNLRSRFSALDGYGTEFTVPESASDYKRLHEIANEDTKAKVLAAFAESFGTCWIVGCAFFLAALVITLPTRSYSLNRARGQAALEAASPSDQPAIDLDLEAQANSQDRSERVSADDDLDQDESEGEKRAKDQFPLHLDVERGRGRTSYPPTDNSESTLIPTLAEPVSTASSEKTITERGTEGKGT